METIGFAGKYYTLWETSEKTIECRNGHCTGHMTHYQFIKNISMDCDRAMAAYPNAQFDEQLNGTRKSFDTKPTWTWDNVDMFRFGKYRGQLIQEVDDAKYTSWYRDQVDGEHRDFVTSYLISRGYVEDGEKMVSPEWMARLDAQAERKFQAMHQLEEYAPIKINVTRNLNADGVYKDGDMRYSFGTPRELWYQGIVYYLPILNGKTKRIKNHEVTVDRYTWSYDDGIVTVNVENFTVA